MIPRDVQALLEQPSPETVERLLDNESVVFLVDWREVDSEIVACCESILRVGLTVNEVQPAHPGDALQVGWGERRVRTLLAGGVEDRHRTLRTINQVLTPEYEIRVCVDSNGGDTLAFLPLAGADWALLEQQYGPRVARHFGRLAERPNVFTDRW